MNKERVFELMSDYLAHEITRAEQKELQELLDSDPELAQEAQKLQDLWELMDEAVTADESQAKALQQVWQNITSQSQEDELSEEDLEKAAGGIYTQKDDQDPYKDQNI
ncbi:MAG: anti-sigma factor family protein [Desulfohalobiaceae bacterium]